MLQSPEEFAGRCTRGWGGAMVERRFMSQSGLRAAGHGPLARAANGAGPGRIEIDHFMRAYHTTLQSSGEVQIRALIEPYLAMNSALHVGARDPRPDLSAITYEYHESYHKRLGLAGIAREIELMHDLASRVADARTR